MKRSKNKEYLQKWNELEYLVNKKLKNLEEKKKIVELRAYFGFEDKKTLFKEKMDINDYIRVKKSDSELEDKAIAKILGVSYYTLCCEKRKHGVLASDFKKDVRLERYLEFLKCKEKHPGKSDLFICNVYGFAPSAIWKDRKHYEKLQAEGKIAK